MSETESNITGRNSRIIQIGFGWHKHNYAVADASQNLENDMHVGGNGAIERNLTYFNLRIITGCFCYV